MNNIICRDHRYYISLRLCSESGQLQEVVTRFLSTKSTFSKKMVYDFSGLKNEILFSNICITDLLEECYQQTIRTTLESLINEIALISDSDITKEIIVCAEINNQQFGFTFSKEMIDLAVNNGYDIRIVGRNSFYNDT